ncbi:hypothetical protein L6164_030106 [Bauhinia variegata]|uniref:Uncharacterized protein n=1 Tax=Bauhinia variegata TaxID=167791 RepID=A0ACB9LBP3_BAUVA|nr:hypothetical protein L6164_030106 [Bauhinia variegata]
MRRMERNWKFSPSGRVVQFVVVWLLFQSFGLCWSLNDEGKALLKLRQRVVSDPFGALSDWIDHGEVDPCNWFGVECSEGRVAVLNLRDLCLVGTLAPELANLVHIKSIILRNNSFFGIIPEEFVELKELEVLDLGFNNFSGPVPADLGSNISLAILLLDNNELLGGLSPEITELKMLSEFQVDENQLTNTAKMASCTGRSSRSHGGQDKAVRILRDDTLKRTDIRNRENPPPEAPSPSPVTDPPSPNATAPLPQPASPGQTAPAPSQSTPAASSQSKTKNTSRVAVLAGVLGGVFLLISIIVVYLWKTNKVATVKPWATGLSGQLQKAFVNGVPKLKRSEVEAACEDFSNVISTSPVGTVYKGTLSSGVEIAVASITVTSSQNWSKHLEAQFLKKIDALSKVNHKNFVNLLGYCEEEEPFTRMVVFEYAPNGTVFEHLHFKEAEHLDWGTRLRIAMGMAYCLQHMHQLDPPIVHSNLSSQAVCLTDDYAGKVSDFGILTEIALAETKAVAKRQSDVPSASPASNVYSFGVILFEMVTGRLPYSVDNKGSLEDWASHYLQGSQQLKEKVDPTLESFQEEQLEQIDELIKSCVHPDPEQRPTMKEVSLRLKEITGITAEGAVPKLSPLWWAELEISSADAS